LLGELLDFAAVYVDLRREADGALLLRLLEESGGSVELRVGGGDALLGGDDLEVLSADREDDGVSGIAHGELRRMDLLAGGAEVVPCGEIDDRLRDVAAQVDVVVRADDGGEVEAGDGNMDAQSLGGEVGLLQRFGEVAADVGKQRAAGDLALTLGLERGAIEVCRAKVEVEAALDGVAQGELAGKRELGRARRASGVGALHLHGGIDGGDAIGGSCDGSFDGGDGATVSCASGERQRGCQCMLRLRRALGRCLRWKREGPQICEEGDCSEGEDWLDFYL
jgi:hypothetical protein